MNDRKNKKGQVTTAAQVAESLNLKMDHQNAAAAVVFIGFMIKETGADLSPRQLAGMTKQTARHFLELAESHPEKSASIPFLKEAAALVSLLS